MFNIRPHSERIPVVSSWSSDEKSSASAAYTCNLTDWHLLCPRVPGNIIPLKFQCAIRHGTLWLAVAKKPYSPENWNAVKHDLFKIIFHLRPNSQKYVLFTIFDKFLNATHGFWLSWWISRFIRWRRRRILCWEISQMRQDRQTQREQELLCGVDEEIDALIVQQPQESARLSFCWWWRWRKQRKRWWRNC